MFCSFTFQQLNAHSTFLIGMMVRRIIKAQLDPSFIYDCDRIGNKRVELAGSLIGLIFENLFKRLCHEIAIRAGKYGDGFPYIPTETISQGLIFAIETVINLNNDKCFLNSPSLSRGDTVCGIWYYCVDRSGYDIVL